MRVVFKKIKSITVSPDNCKNAKLFFTVQRIMTHYFTWKV